MGLLGRSQQSCLLSRRGREEQVYWSGVETLGFHAEGGNDQAGVETSAFRAEEEKDGSTGPESTLLPFKQKGRRMGLLDQS